MNYAESHQSILVEKGRKFQVGRNYAVSCTRPEFGQRLRRPQYGRGHRMPTNTDHTFPCPVCTVVRQIKLTKKNKPYITCDPCGIQVFIRGPQGIAEFKRLVESGERSDLTTRLMEMESRYRLTCPECGCKFWAERKLVKTSKFDGSFKGFRCPQRSCEAIVPWEEKQ